MDIGKRLVELREKFNISRNALHVKSNVALSHINLIESGERSPSIQVLQRLCDAIGVNLTEFFIPKEDLEHAPFDISQFAIDPRNHDLIRTIQSLQAAGYSNEMIHEWLEYLQKTLTSYVKKYGVIGRATMAADDITPEEQEVIDKLNKKFFSE